MATGKFLDNQKTIRLLEELAKVHYKRLSQGDAKKHLRIVHDGVLWHLEDYVLGRDLTPQKYSAFVEIWHTCGYDVLIIPIYVGEENYLAIYIHQG